MANWILGHEFQQGWIVKVVSAFKNDALVGELRMALQVGAQTYYISGIEKVDTTAKRRVLNAFMVRQIELVGERRLLDVPLESCPTRKSGLARDGQLRVTET